VTDHALTSSGIPLPLKYFDCVLVLAFVPFGLLASLPVLGVLGGAGIFRRATGLTFAGGMLRPLLTGLTILALGQLGEREDGLTAALLALAAFTVYMILSVIFRPQRNSST
jgi:hypothetical protein